MNTSRELQSTAEPLPGPGDVIGRYRIVGPIGECGSGPLYVAEQKLGEPRAAEHVGTAPGSASVGVRVARKTVSLSCVRPDLTHSPRFRERFFDAASVAARCEHPNVVHVLEMDEVHGRYFASMEYLPGESLAAILARCPSRAEVAPDVAAHLVKRVASAVQYTRALGEALPRPVRLRGVDVAPETIVVTHGGAVKWLGVAAPAPASSWVSSGIRPSPSPACMPSADPATDAGAEAFELGKLLWTCLVPEPPSGALAAGVNGASPRRPPPRDAAALRSVRSDVPEALAAVALRAVADDPRARFPDLQALSSALDRYLLRRDSRTTPEQLRRWMERLFGVERALLQLQVAAGRDVAGALAQLQRSEPAPPAGRAVRKPRPRPLWATGYAASPASTPQPQPLPEALIRRAPSTLESAPPPAASEIPIAPPRRRRQWLPGGLLALATGAALIWSVPGGTPLEQASERTDARVDVRSVPSGASIFVDGEPTGLRTPAVLNGLAPHRPLQVSVTRAGFVAQQRQVELAPGSVTTLLYELTASDGSATFAGAPRDARFYVDGQEVDGKRPVALSLGPHAVRVEAAGALVFSERVEIAAGEQTIRVTTGRAAP